VSASRIDLTWTDNSSDENAFKLQRQPSGGSWTTVTWASGNQTSHADTGLSAGTWCYRIRSHSPSGFSAYVDSTPACVTIGGGGDDGGSTPPPSGDDPAAPSNFAATSPVSGRVDLTWVDNSNDEHSFKLQWTPAGTETWSTIWVFKNETSFSHTGLPDGTYCYRIRSHNTDGFSSYVLSQPLCVSVGS
jgi:titin